MLDLLKNPSQIINPSTELFEIRIEASKFLQSLVEQANVGEKIVPLVDTVTQMTSAANVRRSCSTPNLREKENLAHFNSDYSDSSIQNSRTLKLASSNPENLGSRTGRIVSPKYVPKPAPASNYLASQI